MRQWLVEYENGGAILVRARGKKAASEVGEEESESPIIRISLNKVDIQLSLKGFGNGERVPDVQPPYAEDYFC